MQLQTTTRKEAPIKTVSVKEFAALLGIPERTAYHFAKTDPNLKAIKIGRQIRIIESNIEIWLAQNQIT